MEAISPRTALVASVATVLFVGCAMPVERPGPPLEAVCAVHAAIMGGEVVTNTETPTVRVGSCSGVFVAPDVILTAAHCPDADLGMRVDHPGYVPGHTEHDLAVIFLDEPARNQVIASLEEPALGEARVEGFGLSDACSSGELRSATVYVDEIRDLELLTVPGNGTPCYGDSGAPLYIDDRVVALVSRDRSADGLCRAGASYVRLDSHCVWLTEVVGEPLVGCGATR